MSSLLVRLNRSEYIKSDEITLEDNLEADAQIINLNRLMENERSNGGGLGEKRSTSTINNVAASGSSYSAASTTTTGRSYVFKLVNDTSLVNYIDLRYLNDEMSTAVIILKKRLNYEDICEESTTAAPSSTGQMTCQQTLKIVAINENDFIEIPIEIKKVDNWL